MEEELREKGMNKLLIIFLKRIGAVLMERPIHPFFFVRSNLGSFKEFVPNLVPDQ